MLAIKFSSWRSWNSAELAVVINPEVNAWELLMFLNTNFMKINILEYLKNVFSNSLFLNVL